MLKSVLVLGIFAALSGFISGDFVQYEITDPWIVRFKFSYGDFGGTFVHEHYILTKALIFLNYNYEFVNDYEIFMFRGNLTNKNVVEVYFHEDYSRAVPLYRRFDLALLKMDLKYHHTIPVVLRRDYDVDKLDDLSFEEKTNVEIFAKHWCDIGFVICTATPDKFDLWHSYGAGLINYDPETEEHFLVGIFASFHNLTKTKENVGNFVSIDNNIIDWIEAHTPDDTLTVQNYCSKSDDTSDPKTVLKPRIHSQGQLHKFDWQVRIFNNETLAKCGGSLIKPDIILTAASCTKNKDEKVNENSYSLKFKNIVNWQSDIVERVEYCEDCHDNKGGLIIGEDSIAMMFITIQIDLQTITPIKSTYSKTLEELVKESFIHYALVPTIRKDFQIGQPTFTAQRFISENECENIYPGTVGRICSKDRQDYTTDLHDIGSGIIYCNEEIGEPQLYGVLLATDENSKTNLYGFLRYYEHWVHI
ncbi:unnamed protein product [Diamesa hyperborea]